MTAPAPADNPALRALCVEMLLVALRALAQEIEEDTDAADAAA